MTKPKLVNLAKAKFTSGLSNCMAAAHCAAKQ